MEQLIPYVNEWFLSRREHLRAFADYDTRVEGWFKGEFIVLLGRLREQDIIQDFSREVSVSTPSGRKQIDFVITCGGKRHLCEIKALCTSQAAGTPRNLTFYFRDDHVGLFRDFRKLDDIPTQNKCVIGFIYPRPSASQLGSVTSGFPNDLRHWRCGIPEDRVDDHLLVTLWTPFPVP